MFQINYSHTKLTKKLKLKITRSNDIFCITRAKKESFYHELPDMLYFLWMKRDTKNYKCKWKRRKHVLVSRLKFQELDNEHKRKISNEMQETWNYFEIIFFSFTRSVNSLLLSVRARNAVRNVKKNFIMNHLNTCKITNKIADYTSSQTYYSLLCWKK